MLDRHIRYMGKSKKATEMAWSRSATDNFLYSGPADGTLLLFIHQPEKTMERLKEPVCAKGYALSAGYSCRTGSTGPDPLANENIYDDKAAFYREIRHD